MLLVAVEIVQKNPNLVFVTSCAARQSSKSGVALQIGD